MKTVGTQRALLSTENSLKTVYFRKSANYISSQWEMAFSVDPSTVSTNSPPMSLSNPVQGMQPTLQTHYPVQYGSPAKVASVTPPQSISQSQFTGRHSMITARDWQQSVASVFDPHGLKRRWNYSVDMGMENVSKRQR